MQLLGIIFILYFLKLSAGNGFLVVLPLIVYYVNHEDTYFSSAFGSVHILFNYTRKTNREALIEHLIRVINENKVCGSTHPYKFCYHK